MLMVSLIEDYGILKTWKGQKSSNFLKNTLKLILKEFELIFEFKLCGF